jgi:Na+/melibiose symporter-like transporter
LLDTYSVYFNKESKEVSLIIVWFGGSIFGGMITICLFACCYRHLLERFIYPLDYKARKKALRRRKEREEEEQREEEELKEQEE